MSEKEKLFESWLDLYWPLWRQHRDDARYRDLLTAFLVGWARDKRVTA